MINEFWHGDCLDLMPKIPDNSFDLIFADLCYGKTKNLWDKIIPPELLWPTLWRISKPNAAVLLFGQDKFSAMMMLSDPNHRYNIIWEKTTPTGFYNAKKMPLRIHEDIMVFYKKLPTYNPQKTKGHVPVNKFKRKKSSTGSNYGEGHEEYIGGGSTERYPTSIWKFPTDKQKNYLHPTQKPVALIEHGIKTYSNPGDMVLDFVAGSGTLGEACINTGRNFLLIDNDPNNIQKINKRLNL